MAEGKCVPWFACYQRDGLESSVRGGDGRIFLDSFFLQKENIALVFEDTSLYRHGEILRLLELCVYSRAELQDFGQCHGFASQILVNGLVMAPLTCKNLIDDGSWKAGITTSFPSGWEVPGGQCKNLIGTYISGNKESISYRFPRRVPVDL